MAQGKRAAQRGFQAGAPTGHRRMQQTLPDLRLAARRTERAQAARRAGQVVA